MFIKYPLIVLLFFLGCDNNSTISNTENTTTSNSNNEDRDYRGDMRDFVINISEYSKEIQPDFAVIPQNGIELVTDSGLSEGNPVMPYLNAIDGNGQENLFYGYSRDNKSTAKEVNSYLISLLQVSQNTGNSILVIDYCDSKTQIEDSYIRNSELGFISFAATERNLTVIPELPADYGGENTNDVNSLGDAKNFLFFLNYENFETKASLMEAIANTNYDILFLDLFANDGKVFTTADVNSLKTKNNGGKRLVFCYMSIGEAEDYRYYWDADWNNDKPSWLDEENKNWPGNYKVKYWDPNWKNIIMGSSDSYLDKILDSGFNGVYLDIIDGFEYYENQ